MSEVVRILGSAQPGKRSNVTRRIRHIDVLAGMIEQRWRVQPWGWRLKHLTWLFDVSIRGWSPRMRYEAWRNVRATLCAVAKTHLVEALQNRENADYLRPDGLRGKLSGRGRKPLLVKRP
jgi:hypothetical protein